MSDELPDWAVTRAEGAIGCSCGQNPHHRKCQVMSVAIAIVETDDDAENRMLIHVTELQQLADHFKYVLPESTWARMQGAIDGLRKKR